MIRWLFVIYLALSSAFAQEVSELEKYIPYGTYRGVAPYYQIPGDKDSPLIKNYSCKVSIQKKGQSLKISIYTLQYREVLKKEGPTVTNTHYEKTYDGFKKMTFTQDLKTLNAQGQDRVRTFTNEKSGFFLRKNVAMPFVLRESASIKQEQKIHLTLDSKYFEMSEIHFSDYFMKSNQETSLSAMACHSLRKY